MSGVPKGPGVRIKRAIAEQVKNACRSLRGLAVTSPADVERAEHIFYVNYLRKGMTVCDVGANIGELTLLFSRFVQPGGKVFSFEAAAATFEKLSGIVRLSGRKNIDVRHLAMTDRNGLAELYVYPDEYAGWNTLADRPLQSYGIEVVPARREQVRCCTLDTFCDENNITHVDLLKIDVEGAEYQVLLGARQLLERKRVACCVFEFGATTFDMGNTPAMLERYLSDVDYRLRNIVQGDRCFPGRKSALSASFSLHVAEPK